MSAHKITDAATIAASINVSTVEGHNLRALLLRLLAGDDDCEDTPSGWALADDAERDAVGLGLAVEPVGAGVLTPLGREVAAALRPEPWRVIVLEDEWGVALGRSGFAAVRCKYERDAQRIAELFTADATARAKTYQTKSTEETQPCRP